MRLNPVLLQIPIGLAPEHELTEFHRQVDDSLTRVVQALTGSPRLSDRPAATPPPGRAASTGDDRA